MSMSRRANPFDRLEARIADWLTSEAVGECPDRVLAAALDVTRREPQVRGLRRSLSRLRRSVRASWDGAPRGHRLTALRVALAAAIVLVGALAVASLREGSGGRQALTPGEPAHAVATPFLEVTLGADAIPDDLAGILVFRKVYPTATDISFGDGFVPPNTFVRYVEGGEIGLRPRSDVQVIRRGTDWDDAEIVPAGGEVVVGPGDAFVMQDVPWDDWGSEALGEMWTPGEDARVVGFAIRESSRCCAMTHPGMQSPWYHTLLQGVDALHGSPVTLRMTRWEVPPMVDLPVLPTGAIGLRAVDQGIIVATIGPGPEAQVADPGAGAAGPAPSAAAATVLTFQERHTIQLPLALEPSADVRLENPGPSEAIVYELIVEPAGDGASLGVPTGASVDGTGPMLSGRSGHVSTLLESGKVLVSGGGCSEVETYDPLSGTFEAAGDMASIRAASATLLEDGRVLLAGGSDVAEVYDHASNTVGRTGSLLEARHFQSAVRLQDGRVLVTGGQTATAEIYDPSSGSFTRSGNLLGERARHTSVLLLDQRVLVAGGGQPVLELYDPETDSFSASGASGVQAFDRGTATRLGDGRVLLVGHGAPPQLYDPTSDSVTTTGAMVVPRYDHAAVLLDDGRVLLVGGMDGQRLQATASIEVFDPRTESFVEVGSLQTARWQPAASKLFDGTVLVTGGTAGTAPTDSAERVRVDPAS